MIPRIVQGHKDTRVSEHPLLTNLEPAALSQLLTRSQLHQVRAGALLIREGDAADKALLIHSGSARQVATAGAGEGLTTIILRAPAAVGAVECMLGRPYAGSVEAVEKTTILEIPAPAFRDALAGSPAFSACMLKDVAALLCVSVQRQSALAFCPVQDRLAHALVSLVEAYGLPVAGGIRIRVAFSRDQLASILGVNRRSVARALKWWFNDGALCRAGRNLVVRDLGRLRSAHAVPLVHTSGCAKNPWLAPRPVRTRAGALVIDAGATVD
ncbi:MAG: Crp/Fnr family transcriptional regulator [Deltaproteobacteria bacterium]|nr:Crp/Fnr family transcriptional regulator [Deltaproteobacteria bacterium]